MDIFVRKGLIEPGYIDSCEEPLHHPGILKMTFAERFELYKLGFKVLHGKECTLVRSLSYIKFYDNYNKQKRAPAVTGTKRTAAEVETTTVAATATVTATATAEGGGSDEMETTTVAAVADGSTTTTTTTTTSPPIAIKKRKPTPTAAATAAALQLILRTSEHDSVSDLVRDASYEQNQL